MRELQLYVSLSKDNRVLLAVPVNKAVGTVECTQIMTARLYTQDEVDKETAAAMQDGCHTYDRKHRRIIQKR